jgi:predicted MFS family arabinose efflux permease
MWTATVIANIGSWMSSAASGWLMTTLNPDPFIVSMVQVAATLPMFLFALPAGALADIIDRRKFLIVAETAITVGSAIYAAIVSLGLATAGNLLMFTFLIGVAVALTAPAWQSIVPQLVPKQDLHAAVAANSVGVNVSRAVGPALGGVIVAKLGIAAPFWFDAISNLGIIAALMWWRPPRKETRHLPVERFSSAIRTGFRHARNNPHLRATLIRGAAFFLFASAYWALLPLVARNQIAGGPDLYGFLLGAIGVGAVGGAFALSWLKAKLGPDRLVAAGSVGTAVAMTLFGLARNSTMGLFASVIAGMSWIAVLSSLNVSAQVALPEWVRGRGLAMFVTVFFGALSLGSNLGTNCRDGRSARRTLHGRGGCPRCDSPDVALEAANRRRNRPHAVDALAGTNRQSRSRGRSGAGACHRRIQDRSARPRTILSRARKARLRASTRRRLRMGRFRGCRRRRPNAGNLPSGLLA